MGAVSDLNHSALWRGPVGLRIAPPELEVKDRVLGRRSDEVFEDGRPFDWTWDVVHLAQDFGGFDVVVPGFCVTARDL